MSMTVLGIEQTLAALAAVGAKAQVGLEAGQAATAEEVADIERTTHPWNNVTGETEGSITANADSVTVAGASEFLEWGTSKMAARPFVRPAADAATGVPGEAAMAAALRL